ncbi:putative potassium transporter TRK-1 [Fusarium heterosporum]|uniref:Putative potassium transporter TRK-1 n=1 Tax=Fusarium heterosporum TaxID=42747 RepID=A0A8H5WES8_FUSHE|nr:putative potassium transporter TRK-1 [Fusarium heterosporum]
MAAIDAWFFGASASTESGLNTIDVKALKTYQQVYIYLIPILTNFGFINIIVVIVRLFWFKKHLRGFVPHPTRDDRPSTTDVDVEGAHDLSKEVPETGGNSTEVSANPVDRPPANLNYRERGLRTTTITFNPSTEQHKENTTLYIPGPRDRERGQPIVARDTGDKFDDDGSVDENRPKSLSRVASNTSTIRRRHRLSREDSLQITAAKSMDRVVGVAASILVMGSERTPPRPRSVVSATNQQPAINDIPFLSRQATIGRNSQFHNLTKHDREVLGGIEYRSLKLLLKIVVAYFFGVHLFGAICLSGWIHTADPKYGKILQEAGQGETWWGFYSAQTMVNNLGFTLTPDSMISFRDAKWPMILMSFLAFAGNTLYPCFLRLAIWIMSKVVPKNSSTHECLSFLLDHPRRCYTLLFPSLPTWILFGIIFVLNFVDILLIIVLDLNNPEVSSLPLSARIPAAIFQAASARHTGTATFNLANVNPAVQLSLLIMMYIAIFPIAISIRVSNTYEEKSLGIWEQEESLNEANGKSYLLTHMKNQLGFDLWYIFLSTFCICIAESGRIADVNDPAFSVFSILFEVTSAYGNVGLSLGYPTVSTSLCGMFGVFGKVVICFTMIRGRHRGLPYALDRSIILPSEQPVERSAQS